MSKFKVGDKVRRIRGNFRGMFAGDVDVVVGVFPEGVQLKKTTPEEGIGVNRYCHDVDKLEKFRSIILENK